MKTIGLIGGMSWESSLHYYKIINERINSKLGLLHSSKCILYSVDFNEIADCQKNGDWARSAQILSDVAVRLQNAGADFIVLCTNTMHKVAADIEKNIGIPFLHIADLTADELIKNKIKKTLLLGTIYTMGQDFYKERLIEKSIEVVIPEKSDRDFINDVIFNELCLGVVKDSSKSEFINIINRAKSHNIGSVILGCTEIGMLIGKADVDIPIFDTTIIHAEKAADLSIG